VENESLAKVGKGEGSMVSLYKEKLLLEMQESDRAFELFLNLNERVLKLI
jgi:hypothetical protein